MEKPIIMVHIAYRLNFFGYTVYKDQTNFGFHDQKRGIDWVRKHIEGFGGDPVGYSAFLIHLHVSINSSNFTAVQNRPDDL